MSPFQRIKEKINFKKLGIILAVFTLLYGSYKLITRKSPIHIAFAGPVTGSSSIAGKTMLNAIQIYLDDLNSSGGVNGSEVVLDIYDDQNDPEIAREKAEEIIKDDKALAVIGHWFSSCSLSAGPVYRDNQIVALTPGSTNVQVTRNNDWYFRNIYTSEYSTSFLAHYIKKILKYDHVTLVYENEAFGSDIARVLKSIAPDLELEIRYDFDFNATSAQKQEQIKNIVGKIKSKKDLGIIILAVQAEEGFDLVREIRDANITLPIIGSSPFAGPDFVNRFRGLPREERFPGYYTNDIYVVTPMIYDTANEKAQEFRDNYFHKYKEEPGWAASYAHDAALMLVESIKASKLSLAKKNLAEDRNKIKNFLTGLNGVSNAIEGVTGLIYFDAEGDIIKPITIGVYKNNNIVSALVQFSAVEDIRDVGNIETAIKQERVLPVQDALLYKTQIVYVGMNLNEITEMDIRHSVVTLDIDLWFRYQGELDFNNIEFLNAEEPIKLDNPQSVISSGSYNYRLFRIKGKFGTNFVKANYGEAVVGITFHDRDITKKNLLFVNDTISLKLDKLLEDQHYKEDVLHPGTGWSIIGVKYFTDILRKASQGDPRFIHSLQNVVSYSRYNAAIIIKENKFSLRNFFGLIFSYFIVIVSMGAAVSLFIAYRRFQLHQALPRASLLAEVSCGFIFLIGIEVVLLNYFEGRWSYYNIMLLSRVFDMAWWLVPAFFLNLAVERFVWRPLEEKTAHAIPNVVRGFTALFIFLISIFGIIAYVYDQPLTSLLATSSVIAMIIGLAIQVNISNVFSGIALNIERPFRVGDWIKVGDFEEGKVIDITWRTTKIKTRDEVVVSIPNSSVAESPIKNFNYPNQFFEAWAFVNIDPSHSPERVEKILTDAIMSATGVLRDPKPFVRIREISEWAAQYTVGYYVKEYDRKNAIKKQVWSSIWTHLSRAGIAPAVQRQELFLFKGVKARGETAKDPLVLLSELELFRPFSEREKKIIAKKMHMHIYFKDQLIVKQGDPGRSLFLIVEGVVGIVLEKTDGNVEVTRLGAGNIFGEMALLTGEPRSTNVVALSRTIVYEITKDHIANYINSNPEISKNLSEVLANRKVEREAHLNQVIVSETEKTSITKQFLLKIQQFFGDE